MDRHASVHPLLTRRVILGASIGGMPTDPQESFLAGIMVASSRHMDVNVQDGTDGLKKAFESTTIVDNNETAEANFQENFLN